MKKTKINPELLKEELKRFNILNEYSFYQERSVKPEDKDLILGSIDEEEVPNDAEPADEVDKATANVANELGVDTEEETTGDIPEKEQEPVEPVADELEEPESDDVEIDVTSLVKGSEEAKQSADVASRNSKVLIQQLKNLEAKVASMDKITAKIDSLEKEFVKRNPTPVEKLELRSLSSYPYTQKLTDYWAEKEGTYDVMDKKEEYILTKDIIDSTYSDSKIKDSFNVKSNTNNYEEEDI